jgi:hypothetical protein
MTARNSGFPWETNTYEKNDATRKPPAPPSAKTEVTTRRETNSVLPRRLRNPFTNMRQRNSAMTFSWEVTESGGVIMGNFILAQATQAARACV